jgi:hypothetical protein
MNDRKSSHTSLCGQGCSGLDPVIRENLRSSSELANLFQAYRAK